MIMIYALVVFVATTILVPVVAHILRRKGILDGTDRVQISHEIPTPRGGGLAVMPIIFIAWACLFLTGNYHWPDMQTCWAVLACGGALCAFTWLDDFRPGGLGVRERLLIQLVCVAIPLILWPADAGKLLPDFVPVPVERILMALAWLWFCNLYNFMDGINGISGAEAICITGALLLFSIYTPAEAPAGFEEMAVIPLAAAAGYLIWNFRKVAKVFLGDVGSVGFGYTLGFLLFVFAANNYLVPAALISMVYSVDASFTLIKRAWQRKKIWQSHREHYYHRATVKGALTHHQCVGIIVGVNIVLIALGYACLQGYLSPLVGFLLGLLVSVGLMAWFYYIGYVFGHVSSPRPKPFRIERQMRVYLKRSVIGRRNALRG